MEKKKYKILYVYGFGSSPDSNTVKMLRKALSPEEFDVVSIEYPQEDFGKSMERLDDFIREECVDLVVGSSLGAFITLNLGADVPKVAVNPCMEPFKMLAVAGVSAKDAESYREATENIWNHSRNPGIFGFFADQDELFGTIYRGRFGECFGDWCEIHSQHHLNEGCVDQIVSKVKEMLDFK